MTWCLDLVFREIRIFSLLFFTGRNATESSSNLLKQSPLKICCVPAALLKRDLAQLLLVIFGKILRANVLKDTLVHKLRKLFHSSFSLFG